MKERLVSGNLRAAAIGFPQTYECGPRKEVMVVEVEVDASLLLWFVLVLVLLVADSRHRTAPHCTAPHQFHPRPIPSFYHLHTKSAVAGPTRKATSTRKSIYKDDTIHTIILIVGVQRWYISRQIIYKSHNSKASLRTRQWH